MTLYNDVIAAIDEVVDPCSQAMGVPIGLAEMGMATVDRLDTTGADVSVRLRLTSPCCAYGPTMARAVEEQLRALPAVRTATVSIDHSAQWSPTMLTQPAQQRLQVRRQRTVANTGVQPYDWGVRRDG